MNTINSANKSVKLFVMVLVIIGMGYIIYSSGHRIGYKQAQDDIKTSQNKLAKVAAEKAAKAANPFQVSSNPLEGVADPLTKTKNILNPFK